ncbi:galactokinase [Catenibacillus scindens]|uniref:Galactokinase n=1 Tax=Catenibacillus scindens TaxID=673271 RepID=A0A7W8H9D8_9FIRM|nr:galactokinase [Catenibacillus scindens]MBB5264316.1 galactokinase [Catenibacillus scindens]
MSEIIEKLRQTFIETMGGEGEFYTFFAPGRVNLIGEHTDYNGGHVFPCALTVGTYGAARKRTDKKLRFYSLNFQSIGMIESDLSELVYKKEDDWANYVKGVIWAFKEAGMAIDTGMDFVCVGNIPNKSGLSSSASLEILTCKVIADIFKFDVDGVQAAKLGQYGENHFVGVNCGIMDQFAIAMGKADHGIFLDTATLEYKYVPVHLAGYRIVIGNTNKVRRLEDSKYNERRSQCETALADIRKIYPVQSFGALTVEAFDRLAHAIKDPVNGRRARHAVSENQRTIQAVKALENNDLTTFGQLMNASHVSLRDDYEVTGIELDTLVEAAWQQEGVVGARMTGAGFGGCSVSIVRQDCVDAFIKNVGDIYKKRIGYAAQFYVVEIGDGPKQL